MLILALRYFVSIPLFLAGISKSVDLQSFNKSLRGLIGSSDALGAFLTYFVPALEICLGFYLLLGVLLPLVASLSTVLLASFSGLRLFFLVSGKNFENCGCGALVELSSHWSQRYGEFIFVSCLFFVSLLLTILINLKPIKLCPKGEHSPRC